MSDEMPDEIWVVGKSADLHAQHEDLHCLWSHRPTWTNCTKYTRADTTAECIRDLAEALEIARKRNADAMAQARAHGAPGHVLEIGANEDRIFRQALASLNALGE